MRYAVFVHVQKVYYTRVTADSPEEAKKLGVLAVREHVPHGEIYTAQTATLIHKDEDNE